MPVTLDTPNARLRRALTVAPRSVSSDRRELAVLAREYLERRTISTSQCKDGISLSEYEAAWRQLADEQGWPGLSIPEDMGGLGYGFAELAVVIGECGRALVFPELVGTSVLGVSILLESEVAISQMYLARVARGHCRIAVVDGFEVERGRSLPLLSAARLGDGSWRLNGLAGVVIDAARADLVLARAECEGATALYAFEIDTPGVQLEGVRTLDLTRAAALVNLTNVTAHEVADGSKLPAIWERARLLATVAIAVEQVAGADRALALAVEYVKSREQFGRRIGSFQAIKHRCADLLTELEAARSATEFAVWAADQSDTCLPLASSIAKVAASEAFRSIAAESIQLHGGIGFTWDHDAHLYFRRACSDEVLLGDGWWHRAEIAKLLDFEPVSGPPLGPRRPRSADAR